MPSWLPPLLFLLIFLLVVVRLVLRVFRQGSELLGHAKQGIEAVKESSTGSPLAAVMTDEEARRFEEEIARQRGEGDESDL